MASSSGHCTDSTIDLHPKEYPSFSPEKLPMPNPHLGLVEAAALLSLWSLLIINDGAVRVVEANPTGGLSGGRPPAAVSFVAGLLLVLLGIAGLFLGCASFVRKSHSLAVTKLVLAAQVLFGTYVFIVFVFLTPSFRAADLAAPAMPGLSLGQSRFLISLGALTSFHFYLALQGGQIDFLAAILTTCTGRDFLHHRSGTRMRAVVWNANMAAAGLWTFATGLLVRINAGERLEKALFAPPNVILLPGMTTWTGIVMMFWATVGIFITVSKSPVPKFYFPVTAYVYLSGVLNYAIVQLGLSENPNAGNAATRAGLVFVTVFLGPYYVQKAAKEQAEGRFLRSPRISW